MTERGCLGAITVAHLQQARGEVGAGQSVLWTQTERVAEFIGGCGVVSLIEQGQREFCQNVRASRSRVVSDHQDGASL